jgi:glycerophosphoryl diester phosphodiesterase
MGYVRPAWLTARPIAHRGLHNVSAGIIENSISAARAAISGGYAIECDVQPSADGEVMVFHDFTLERLTERDGRVDAFTALDLGAIKLNNSSDHIPTLREFLDTIAGRVPLVCEIKSGFDGDMRLAERAALHARDYAGPMCLKSFDPAVIAHLQANRARLGLDHIPLGMIAQADFSSPDDEWAHLSADAKRALAQFLHWSDTKPDFLSWGVRDLPHATPNLCRVALGMPVMTWAVRTPEQVVIAKRWADQMVFEGFRP